jgi:hypothetical protein
VRRLFSICAVLLTSGFFHASPMRAAERWRMQLLYDKDNSTLELRDIQCPSATRCVAAGVIEEDKGHPKGTAVLTSDGGEHWSYVEVKELPVSLFFLNDSLGWMVTNNGIWQTEESGRTWKKLKGLKAIERVWFQDRNHGWAVGHPKAVYETTDGGKEWVKVAAAQKPATPADATVYNTIVFAGPQFGIIAGNWDASPHENLPAWMDPGGERRKLTFRGATVMLKTTDGGKNWEPFGGAGDGYLTQLRLTGAGAGLALFEFPGSANPSALFKLDLNTRRGTAVYQPTDKVLRDVAMLPDGAVLLATIELPGKSKQIPIPGKLKMLRSRTLETWLEVPADYRAVATRAMIAAADANHVWVATDTGMILKLSDGDSTKAR